MIPASITAVLIVSSLALAISRATASDSEDAGDLSSTTAGGAEPGEVRFLRVL